MLHYAASYTEMKKAQCMQLIWDLKKKCCDGVHTKELLYCLFLSPKHAAAAVLPRKYGLLLLPQLQVTAATAAEGVVVGIWCCAAGRLWG